MVFEEIIRYSPRRRALPRIAEGFSPTASTLSSMNLWIQMFQFHAGIGGGETPVYSDGFLVPLLHPCLDLPMQGGLVWNPAIQQLLTKALNSISAIFSQLPCLGV